MPDTNTKTENRKRPHILLIFPDQWRGDSLSCLGHPTTETPYIDEIAAGGTTFTAAYAQAPTCIPARACLATGMGPSSNGRLGYVEAAPWPYETTMMSCLRDGGYQTFNAGKTHFYPQRLALGFEESRLYEAQCHDRIECDYHRWLERETGGRVIDTVLAIHPNSVLYRPWTADEYLHPNNWTTESAIELLERRDPTRPFFMQVGYQRPHIPVDPPTDYYRLFEHKSVLEPIYGDWCADPLPPQGAVGEQAGMIPLERMDRFRRGYFALLNHIDTQIGRLLNYLRINHLLEDTLIIFASDHGEQLGDHGMFGKKTPLEGSAKIPLIIRPPTWMYPQAGSRSAMPATHIDIMPTVLEAAGIPIPSIVEGISLMQETADGESSKSPSIGRDWLHGEHTGAEGFQFVTDGKEKYVWQSADGTEWFFDLTRDPTESHNLADDPESAERMELWRQRLIETLSQRPEDGLCDGSRLIPGKTLPGCREWIYT